MTGQPQCEDLCVWSDEIGVPGFGVAYAHPDCPLHAALRPDEAFADAPTAATGEDEPPW